MPENSTFHSDNVVALELGNLLFAGTLTTDKIQSDHVFQSRLAALLNGSAIPSNQLALLLTSLLDPATLQNDLRSACTQFFAMDWFSFISRSACEAVNDGAWSNSERTALQFVTQTMLLDDGVSPREVLLAVHQRLMQVRAQYVDAVGGGDVGYESGSDEDHEDEAQGEEQQESQEGEQSLDRQAVFILICGLHAVYHALISRTAKKRSQSLHTDLLSAWLPLRALTSSPACARLFLSSSTPIVGQLLASSIDQNDTARQSFTFRILGHFLGLLPRSDPLVQSHLTHLPLALVDDLLPSVAIEDHVLTALVIPSAPPALAVTHFDSLLDSIGGLMLSSVTSHWYLAHALLSHLASLSPLPPTSTHTEPLTDFFARHWLPFLCTHCTNPVLRSLVTRAGDQLISTHLSDEAQATLLADLVHASPYANGKCMLLGTLLQPRFASGGSRRWAGGWPFVKRALVPSLRRDVLALVDGMAAATQGGAADAAELAEENVAGHLMVVLAWVQLAYVLVKAQVMDCDEGREIIAKAVVGPLERLGQRDLVPPVVTFAVDGLKEALVAGSK